MPRLKPGTIIPSPEEYAEIGRSLEMRGHTRGKTICPLAISERSLLLTSFNIGPVNFKESDEAKRPSKPEMARISWRRGSGLAC